MISLKKLLTEALLDEVSYKELLRMTDSARKERARNVGARSTGVRSVMDAGAENTNEAWVFNYKTRNPHSTTKRRYHGKLIFSKQNINPNDSVEDLDCKVHCDCFSGNVPVLMGDGTYRPIKEVNIGDEVYTHLGRIRKVKNIMSRSLNEGEKVYDITVQGFPGVITATENHPFYTLRGNDKCLCGCDTDIWKSVYSHECSSPSLILDVKFSKGHYNKLIIVKDKSEGIFEWTYVKDLRNSEWFLTPWLEEDQNTISPTSDFARLVGYYTAEGCIPKKGTSTRLTFNINEKETLGKDVLEICSKMGYKTKIYNHPARKCFNIEIQNKDFQNFCRNNIGCGSKNKTLSNVIMKWNNECLKNVFIGKILGDGWIDPNRGMKYCSISFNLITQASTILNKLGIRNTISIHRSNFNDKTRSILYQVLIPRGDSAELIRTWLVPYLRNKDIINSPSENLKYIKHYRKEGQLRALTSYTESNYNGMVYDITVEDDESFIANGIVVHNCPDYFYRRQYANHKIGAGTMDPNILGQQHNREAPVPGGHADIGPGLCKHLVGLAEYLQTKIEPVAPKPDDEPPAPEAVKDKPTSSKPSTSKPTTQAPKPDDTPYSDSRTDVDDTDTYSDSRGLEEINIPPIWKKMDALVAQHKSFEVPYED